MDNFNGYKLKPSSYIIKPNDIVIRVKDGTTMAPIGTLGIVLEDRYLSLPSINRWFNNYYEDWRAIETLPGSQANEGNTVYCIDNTTGACHVHDSFEVYTKGTYGIYPKEGHKLLSGVTTQLGWNWLSHNFVVLIKDTSTNSSSIKDSIAAVDPYTAKVGDYVEWENDDALFKKQGHIGTMTRGRLYKVADVHFSCVTITNDKGRLDIWSKDRFKRVPDKVSQEQVTVSLNLDDHMDSLTYAANLPLSYIPIGSMMCKPAPTNQNSKGKQMNQNLFTDILKLLTQTAQTDLQKAPSTYAFFYDAEGTYEGTAKVANEEEAKALLQKPEHLGYTMRIYSFSDEFTTQIPVVSTIKKVTAPAKPSRKPRATKVK